VIFFIPNYNKVASACFYHIRRLKQICRLLGPDVATSLVSAFVLSKLDYCNAILAGLPKTIDVKKRFFTFFILVTFFTFLTFFLFFSTFFYFQVTLSKKHAADGYLNFTG